MRKKSRMIALALAAVMALTACSSNSDSPAASEADKTTAAGQEADSTSGTEAGTPASINDNGEKVLRIGTYMPVTTLVPWKTTSDGDGYIIRQIYHTLLEMNKQSEFAPGLAKSWECSEDGKVWTFHLRDDIYWQTGNDLFGDEKVQVTAEDVKFSFEYYLDPAHESVRYTGLADTIDKI